jgi:tetratricopeptide (TPR) repeat protein
MSHLSITQIEGYLNDTLSSEALKTVEQHLIFCSLCEEAIEGFELQQQKQEPVSAWDSPAEQTPVHIMRKFPAASAKWKWAAAAIITVPLIAGYLLKTDGSAKIFAAHYSTMSADAVTLRSGGAAMVNATKTKMDSAMELFADVKYKESFVALKQIADTETDNLKAAFFAGCSAMELQDWAQAEALLERVHLAENNEFSNHALWYLALTKIQIGEQDRAKDFLRETIAENSPWKSNAERLLKDLK